MIEEPVTWSRLPKAPTVFRQTETGFSEELLERLESRRTQDVRKVEETETVTKETVTQTEVMEEHWTSQLDAAALAASASNLWRPRYMSARDLRDGINYRKRNGLDASEFEEHYWGRWFYPVNVLALCLAAMPFAFGSLRSGGLGRRLFVGVVLTGFALGGVWFLITAGWRWLRRRL